jgi:hypothetical protein
MDDGFGLQASSSVWRRLRRRQLPFERPALTIPACSLPHPPRRGNGRAFITRTCFNAAGYSYTNKFVTFPELVALKGTDVAPLGSVPSLTLPSGRTVVQSAALARFAAKKAGIYPRDNDEAALLIDEIFETALEFANKVPQTPDKEASPRAAVAALPTDSLMLAPGKRPQRTLTLAYFFSPFLAPPEQLKVKLRAEFVEKEFPRFLGFLTKRLGAGPFFFGGAEKFTLADLSVYQVLNAISTSDWDHVDPSVLDKFPEMKAFYERAKAHEFVVKHGPLKLE